jgi:hypothetical protein
MTLRTAAAAVATLAFAVLASPAAASELIDRNASGVKLQVHRSNLALLSYTSGGVKKKVLVWGAINAIAPTTARAQVKFTLDYSGGAYAKQAFPGACRPYDGPKLQWLVTACKTEDGSYWAVQSWQRALPNYGVTPSAEQSVWELRLSHWKGELPVLEVKTNWAYRKFDHIYGRFTYLGRPVHGFRSTPAGLPLDTFGRNLYVDTFNSAYGSGWKRENSFLMHKGTGAFCYGFFPHGARPVGAGTKYRATIIGPGVTPDIYWEGAAPGLYDAALDKVANDEIRALGTRLCKPN